MKNKKLKFEILKRNPLELKCEVEGRTYSIFERSDIYGYYAQVETDSQIDYIDGRSILVSSTGYGQFDLKYCVDFCEKEYELFSKYKESQRLELEEIFGK